MANDCVDVTCQDCGGNWCCRGCAHSYTGTNIKRAHRAREDKSAVICAGVTCYCGSTKIVVGNYDPPIEPTYEILRFESLEEIPKNVKYGTKIFIKNTNKQRLEFPWIEVLYDIDKKL